MHCPVARAIWHGSNLEIRTSELHHSSVKQWVEACILQNEPGEDNRMCFLQSIFTILWSIWNHRNMVLHQEKLPNPMEIVLTSQSLICKYREPFQANQEQKPIYPDNNLNSYSPTKIGILFLKWQRIKTEDPREVAMLLRQKHWKEMFYSQEELAVEGSPIALQFRMLWVKQFSRLWS